MHVLNGIGSEYDPVMVIVSSKVESWSIIDVHSLLFSFENRLESTRFAHLNSDSSQPSLDYIAQSGPQR